MPKHEDGEHRGSGGPALSPDEPAETLPLGTGALAEAERGARPEPPPPEPPPPAAPPPAAPPRPKAPPMASAPTPAGKSPRPPAPSQVIPAPKAPPMAPMQTPPPTASDQHLSPAVRKLMADIEGVAPVFSSFEFSQKLPDYLATYWAAQRDHLKRDANGNLEQDYEDVLARAKEAHDVDAELDMDTVLDQVRDIADELDGDKVPYFAPGLEGNERRLLQAIHDLCLAMIHYKMAVRVASHADRLVMITSSTGAQGCLEMARNRFTGVAVPEAIHNYARLLELKLSLEEENCRQLLGG